MEKLGVVIDEEKTKEASEKEPSGERKCPKCKTILGNRLSPIWNCPNCGTEPFEKKP